MAKSIDQLCLLDATAQAALVRTREVSPTELVDAAVGALAYLDPQLNAVVLPTLERAREHARSKNLPDGPFRGVPFLFKDLGAHLAGDPVHAGMRFLRDLAWTEPNETHLARRLRLAGFVSLGRTNTPELGLLPTTEPIAYGPTHNPWDLARSAGGSSGGAAAAVASGMVPVAHASDGGGSIRVPASACGLVGLKPSRGRCSFGPDLGERWAGFSVEHVLTRSIRDTAAVLDVVHGAHPGDPYAAPLPVRPFIDEVGTTPGRLRVGLLTQSPGGLPVHTDCLQAAGKAAQLLESLGHIVEQSHPPALMSSELSRSIVTIIACSTARMLDTWSTKTGRPITADDVEPLTWAVSELGRRTSVVRYIGALTSIHHTARSIAEWWRTYDLLLSPTMAEPPPLLGHFASTPDDPFGAWARAIPFSTFTSCFNSTGQPALSLPLYWNDEGLPIGVQLVAQCGREDVLLRIGAQLETAHPWSARLPRIHPCSASPPR